MIRNPLYRQDEIVRLCKGKTVLHLGFILHDQWRKRWAEGNWLHARLMAAATRIVGLDYLESEVEAIRQTVACECIVGDCLHLERAPLDEIFDIIVCGELIEHLENAKDFLDGLKRFCHRDTQVIITTPNPWDRKWMGNTKKGLPEVTWLNPEHVVWYSMQTLTNLLERCGYEIVRREYYFEDSRELDKSLDGTARLYWLAKRLARMTVTRPQCQPGLFFVVRPGNMRASAK